ncbi:hypothetical protein [Janibacter limosus]|jgi:uncharacterized membrane protein YdfJ with MMPL/SSD domain|uniref:Uncharacterized protein n=1 Tax=Janibacter limosus TaxID=53458 RepID=A0A4P6MYC0_9MICO|nr:hypothetical protein [Janibacter limosus]QBF46750.1 hypothetical protein EXU32_11135 [Janibacter limosus]
MIAVVTILMAFPLGYLMSSYFAANVTYAVAYLWAFTFQAVYLLPMFIADLGEVAPGGDPVNEAFPIGYGVVTLTVFLAGLVLVRLGCWVRQRRTGAQLRSA